MKRGVRVFAAIALATTVGVSACAKKKPAPPPAAPPPAAEAPRTTPPAPPPPPTPPRETPPPTLTEEEVFAGKTLEQLNSEKPLGDVFFALDSAQLGDEARPILQKDADWLKRWTSTKIMVEGHADSRGSAEYNLALGERRASAVRAYLVSLGLGADRVQIVSKGKEAPFCTEENEACWQQNRRGHFVITAK
ncbi:MAG TPA: OmpA family protein [Vicinamibacterales bacterium]|nr:OmpA family protein [Vicinamibacterales bacterium]